MALLEGKVAIVTGGGGGLGRAQAVRFAEEGCRVVVNDIGCTTSGIGRDPSIADAVVADITAAGGEALASYDDVSQPAEVERMMHAALARFGHVDILVTGAAVFEDRPLLDGDDSLWSPIIDVALRGTYLCMRAVARHLAKRQSVGRILATTSLAGLRGTPGLPIYSAAKGGIYGLCMTAALELKPLGVTVNALSPIAYTRGTADAMKNIPDAAELLSPRHVADVALFLVSDLAADITGAVVEVQGQQVSISRMLQTRGVFPKEPRWTPEELSERWPEIAILARQLTPGGSSGSMPG